MTSKREIKRSQRGVGSIIGGVILAAILFTSVLVFFITILKNEQAKTSYEILAAQANQDKASERFSVVREHDLVFDLNGDLNMVIHINNDGSLPIVASKLLLYCTSAGCPTPDPNDKTPVQTIALNAQEKFNGNVGPISNLLRYRVDVITERGNILSTVECQVNGVICENDPDRGADPEPPCIDCAVTEGIIQGTGSLQLDFKAFSVLFPDFKSRTDNSGFAIDQAGWEVVTSSSYGNATGYPGFDIPQGANAVLVEKARNMDLSGSDLKLNRNTALQILAGNQGSANQQPSVFICKEDKLLRQFTAYNENTAFKSLPWTPLNADRTENWQELFFCSENPSNNNIGSPWRPQSLKWSNLNGILLIARGAFEGTHEEYAQTVPYQAISFGVPGASSFIACSRDGIPAGDVITDCSSPTSPTQGDIAISRYSYTVADILAAKKIFIHLNNPSTGPYVVSWLYPDGNRTALFSGNANARDNLGAIGLPTTMPDGSQIQPGYYTLIVTDSYGTWDNASKVFPKNVFYITFRVR